MPTPSHEQALAQIARAMIGELDLRQIAEVVIDQCVHSLTADAAVLWIADSTLRELQLLAERGVAPQTVDEIKVIPFDAPLLAALVARTCRVQVIDNLRRAPPKPPIRTLRAFAGMQANLVVPLTVHQRLVGVISHGFRTPRHFSADDLSFNITAADMFAVTILNARLYDQTRQTLQLHEEFMAAAAHELRTPLTVIKGGTQRALRSDAREKGVRSAFEAILHATDRIDRIVDDLLTIQKVRPGHVILHCSCFDLGALVRTMVDETARANAEHEFRLQVRATSEVDADRRLIATAIRHLLAYAICYTATGGPIEVGVDREDEDAVISVTRHGPHIPPERQLHLFEPFYESIPPGAPGYAGVASVGLYLSKLIAEAHGGRIGLAVGPGDRETVWFSLPLAGPADG